MFDYPQRTAMEYNIPTKRGKLKLVINQATATETNRYYEICNKLQGKDSIKDKMRRFSEYKSHRAKAVKSSVPDLHWRNVKKRVQVRLVIKYIDFYKKDLENILHRQRVSKYIDMPQAKTKKQRPILFNNTTGIISKEANIDGDKVEDILTAEQIGRWVDKITFDYYETFDDGKHINTMLKSKQGISGKHKELLEYMGR